MSELKPRITENGIDYILVGDYYIPDLKLPEEHRPIGKYGRLHREYLREIHPARLNTLTLTGELWTYLSDLNEQAQERLDTIMEQMKAAMWGMLVIIWIYQAYIQGNNAICPYTSEILHIGRETFF